MRSIHLHGRLKRFGAHHRLDVATAGEAVRALNINNPGFVEMLREGYYEIVSGPKKSGYALDVEDINDFRLGKSDLHIIPVAAGSKRGGVLKAILGVVLIGAALFFSGGTLAGAIGGAGATGFLGGITWSTVAFLGLGLAVAGASQLLTPQEKKKDKKDESYTLAGPTNVYEQGQAVPLVYGEVITGGAIISAGMDIDQIGDSDGTSSTPGTGGTPNAVKEFFRPPPPDIYGGDETTIGDDESVTVGGGN